MMIGARITRYLFILTAALSIGSAVQADEVTSKGTVLRGKVTAISADGLSFEPEYGKGSIAIKWADVEDVRTDGSFQVLYGDGLTLYEPLQGVSGGNLLVGADAASATQVEYAGIHSGVPIGPDGPSFVDRERAYWRYWDGSFDVAIAVQQATVDSTGFLIGFKTTRKKDPTRLILAADYRYTTQKSPTKRTTAPDGTVTVTGGESTIEDRAFGLIRGEYDITSRLYAYASGDATYDGIQDLSIRGVPQGGLGYLIWEEKLDEEKRNFLSGEAGPGWVYEKYFDETDDNFFTVAFGAAAGYHLPYGAHIGYRGSYLPAVDDWANDYLIRNELILTLPVYGPIAAKFTLLDEYNSTPAPDTDRNSLFLTFGLSILW